MRLFTIVSICLFSSIIVFSQMQEIQGKIIADEGVEGLHVLNKTALKYTVSDADGRFKILAKHNDSIVITGLGYKTKHLVVTPDILKLKIINVYLKTNVTALDQVIVGRLLTGNLASDVKNTEIKIPINFYDLGIPGYTGKQKTLSERKLIAATSSGGGIPIVALINAITGETKSLKARVKLSKEITCVEQLKANYKNVFFEDSKYTETFKNRFFNFILDSEQLEKVCPNGTDFEKVKFLQSELILFNKLQKNNEAKN